MPLKQQTTRWVVAAVLVSIMALTAALPPAHLTFAKTASFPSRAAHKCIVITGSGDTTFTRNFDPFGTANDLNLTHGAIYNTLFIFTTAGGGKKYAMLGTKYAYSKDAKTLTITLRKGVKWSDGKPFTSADVVFTLYGAPKMNKAYDQIGILAPDSSISSVTASGPYTVLVHFNKRDVIAGEGLLTNPYIIPQHIWSKVADPAKFTNPNPVGTGPFTQVLRFGGQDFTMGKNPHFWMKGKPAASCVERVYSSGNDAAELMMIKGDVDWTGNFIANAQKAYVSHDPTHFHYFYATNSDPVGLFYDDTKYPWSLVGFRKAVSMAIDRSRISNIGEYGYGKPPGPLGIEREYPKWIDPTAEKMGASLVKYDPAAAKKALLKMGFKYQGSDLVDPHGNKVSFEMDVIAGWTDWVLSMQILGRDLKAIGISTSLHLSPDQSTWANRADKAQVLHFHWPCGSLDNPYSYLFNHLATRSKQQAPPGQEVTSGCDWERYADPKADALFKAWRSTSSVSQQKKDAAKLEQLFVKDVPFIPAWVNPIWYTYSTKYWTNWPTSSNYYAIGAEWHFPDNGLVMADVKPIK